MAQTETTNNGNSGEIVSEKIIMAHREWNLNAGCLKNAAEDCWVLKNC